MAEPTVTNCTRDDAERAVKTVVECFSGGSFISDAEKRQLNFLFLKYTAEEVGEAIRQLVKQGLAHPRPDNFGDVLKTNRKFRKSQEQANTPNPTPGDPDAVPAEDVPTLAQLAKACGDRDPEKAAAARVELDLRTGVVRV